MSLNMWNPEENAKDELTWKAKIETHVESKLMDTEGKKEGWDELEDWDWHIHTTIYKVL